MPGHPFSASRPGREYIILNEAIVNNFWTEFLALLKK